MQQPCRKPLVTLNIGIYWKKGNTLLYIPILYCMENIINKQVRIKDIVFDMFI